MLFELAIGDAYGAGFEFCHMDFVREHNKLKYVQHPIHTSIKLGCYTDDTQMSIAIAELMVTNSAWTKRRIATHFLQAFNRDPRKGYSIHFQQFLAKIKSSNDFINKIKPNSIKSGAAMRACPIGFYEDVELVKALSRQQAIVTHDTPEGIISAQAASLLSHYFIYDIGDRKDAGKYVFDHVNYKNNRWDNWCGTKVGSRGIDSVTAAITAVVKHDSLKEILKACISYSGDTDTVAAIALGAASNSDQFKKDLPKNLEDGLEDGIYGRAWLQHLDTRLTRVVKGTFNY